MMSGSDDDRCLFNTGAEVAQSMFPPMDTSSDMAADMELDETYSLVFTDRGTMPVINGFLETQNSILELQVLPSELGGATDVFMRLGILTNIASQIRPEVQALKDTERWPAFTTDLKNLFETHSSAIFPNAEGLPSGAKPDIGSLPANYNYYDQSSNGFRPIFGAHDLNGVSSEPFSQPVPVERILSLTSINRNRAISLSEKMECTYLPSHPDSYYGNQKNLVSSFFPENGRGLMNFLSDLPHQLNANSQSPENPSTNAFLDTPEPRSGPVTRLPMEKRDHASYRTSLMGQTNELLPFTTSTSFAPSVSSLRLNQHSFLSAQQYFRPLMEQPPAVANRGSMEMYSRYGMTPDSLLLETPPVRHQKTFASYFSFMDKDRKHTSPSESVEDGSELLQPRTLIRSIFKGNQMHSSHQLPPDELAVFNSAFDDTVMDDEQYGCKTPKRVKRGIFDRFKSYRTPELQHAHEGTNSIGIDGAEQDVLDFSYAHINRSAYSQPQISRISSILDSGQNSGQNSIGGSLNAENSAGLDNPKALEPNYGALFKGVAKRRTLVSMKGKKKTAAHLKKEMNIEETILDNLSPALSKASVEVKKESQDFSPSLSHVSSISKGSDIEDQGSVSGSLANASRRILGSRLLKRRASPLIKQEDHDSNLVEVDLQDLDLPANTEILLLTEPKLRTRGRREDKEADLVDDAKIYICGFCSRRFKRQEHLKRHFRSLHTSEKPYDCPKCRKKFSRTDNLNQHLKVHRYEGEKEKQEITTEN